MTPLVPKKMMVAKAGRVFEELSDLLLSALEFIGAAAGWIGLHDTGGELTYPVRGGVFSENWLPTQQGQGVWGFAVDAQPALFNEVQPWSKLVVPPLRNLLSCPLIQNDNILGHVSLANKAHGFTTQDSLVLQGLAHHMARLLGRRASVPSAPITLPAPWQRILDGADEAVLVLDEAGTLIYTNATWLEWTGFRAEELLGRTAPFPFWVSQKDLVHALSLAASLPANLLPFRRSDHSLLWCRLETRTEHWDDRVVTVAFLQSTSEFSRPKIEGKPSSAVPPADHAATLQQPKPDWLPLFLNLDNGIEGWCSAWEERTGLSAKDVEGTRTELMLDWLFPQQHDRDRVADCFHLPRSSNCQFVLEVATTHGSRPMLCTFMTFPVGVPNVDARRWLLLVGEWEQAAAANGNDCSLHRDTSPTLTAPSDQSEPRP